MAHDFTDHKEYKNFVDPPKVHAFYISFDLNDKGELVQQEPAFYDELFDDLVPFAFGPKAFLKNFTLQDFSRLKRKAAKRIYNISGTVDPLKNYKVSHNIPQKYLNRGEFGELILYHLLHEYFNADALISKIYFKDSNGLPAHGFDAVHVDSKNKTLWLGELKLYIHPSQAIDALLQDLKEHFNIDFFKSEFQIIANRAIDDSDENLDPFIKTLLNPNTKILDKLAHIKVALFAAYSSTVFSEKDLNGLKTKLEEEITPLYKKAKKGISNHGWSDRLKVYLILFPVDDKTKLVEELHSKLRYAQLS